MPTLRIPTPLRPYTEGAGEIEIQAATVGGALQELLDQYPALRLHLMDEDGQLRAFVNLFLNDEDVRHLQGQQTELKADDRLMILPSIAGGVDADTQPQGLRKVDHAALRTNQAFIIALNILAYLFDLPWLAGLVMGAMLLGTLLKAPGFGFIYKHILAPLGIMKPDVLLDNPEPHRFAQGFGGVVMLGGVVALYSGLSTLGWGLVWLVIALAALNLFGGFCVGCAVYYWLGRLHLPGFGKRPPQDTVPGMRPKMGA